MTENENTARETPERLAAIVAGMLDNDVPDTIRADEDGEDTTAFLAVGEDLESFETDGPDGARVIYLVGRTRDQGREDGRKLVKITVEAL